MKVRCGASLAKGVAVAVGPVSISLSAIYGNIDSTVTYTGSVTAAHIAGNLSLLVLVHFE
jgi:hypothetical protein